MVKPLSVFLLFGLFLALVQLSGAETVLIGPVKGADVSATIAIPTTLSVTIKNRTDNSSAASVNFGSVPAATAGKAAPQYLEVSFSASYGPNPPVWGIDIYTNNTGVYTGWAKGGLIHDSSKSTRVVMCYAVFDDLQPSLADPSDPFISDPWIYVVDKNDIDDPSTPDVTNWPYFLEINYPRLVYGFDNGSSFLQMGGAACTSPVYIYPAGLFGTCSAGTYHTTLYLDLYHL